MNTAIKFIVATIAITTTLQANALTCMNKKYELQLDVAQVDLKFASIKIHSEAKQHIEYTKEEIFETDDLNLVRLFADRKGSPSLTYDPAQNSVVLSVGNPTNNMNDVIKKIVEIKGDRQLLFENCK